ncbi:MAG: SET domain-containing protein-lysine N-methyltransferase [Flavobacteriales bacterium]
MKKSRTIDSIEAEESDYLYVGTSQIPNSGNGLFTAIHIYPDEIIAVFHGKLLSQTEAMQREQAGFDKYFISLEDGRIFDSMNATGFAHFANDASYNSRKKNNACIELDANNKIALVAISTIRSGSEICCGYGHKYWMKHSNQ